MVENKLYWFKRKLVLIKASQSSQLITYSYKRSTNEFFGFGDMSSEAATHSQFYKMWKLAGLLALLSVFHRGTSGYGKLEIFMSEETSIFAKVRRTLHRRIKKIEGGIIW